MDRAGLTGAGGDAAVAAVIARRRGRLSGLLDLARRRPTLMSMPPPIVMSPRVPVAGGRRDQRARTDRRPGRRRSGHRRIPRQMGR
jgi:hypothetical protein